MNIAVILKQVPDTEAVVRPDPSNPGAILEEDIKFILNTYDEYAVEEALKITEKSGGEVIGVCIGPQRAESAIRSALAMGAHRAVLISEPEAVKADVITQGKILAAAIKGMNASLILCGREAIDTQDDSTAAIVGHCLNIPHVLAASKIDINGDKANVLRDVEGKTLEIEISLPAVISCQKGLNDPRYPTLIAIKRSQKKEIAKVTLAELGIQMGPATQAKCRIVALRMPPPRSEGVKVEGEPEEVVAKCIGWLSNEAKIL